MLNRPLPESLVNRLSNHNETLLLPELLEQYEHEGQYRSLATWLLIYGDTQKLREHCSKAIAAETDEKKKANCRLHYAIISRLPKAELDKIIQASPASLNTIYMGLTVLDCAVMQYDLDSVQYILDKMKAAGFECPCQHWCRRTSALHLAVRLSDGHIAESLLKGGFSCRLLDKEGNTPVHILSKSSVINTHLLEVMIKHVRSQINETNNNDETPLMLAVLNDRLDIIKSCIEPDSKQGQIAGEDNINLHFSWPCKNGN